MSLSSLATDELQEIAAEAMACLGMDGVKARLDALDLGLSLSERFYIYGVLAERQRAGEGRDGLAGRLARSLHAARSTARLRSDITERVHGHPVRESWVPDADAVLAEAGALGLLDEPAAQPAAQSVPPSSWSANGSSLSLPCPRCGAPALTSCACYASEPLRPAPDPLRSPGDDELHRATGETRR